MAPKAATSGANKARSNTRSKSTGRPSNGRPSTGRLSTGRPSAKSRSDSTKAQVKKRSGVQPAKKKKRRIYTEKELGVPTLNMIMPAGVQKPKGKKKGKIFVDDQESMMAILAVVNADKEGQIESKIMRARQLEEIREARKRETEARATEKRAELEDTKDTFRRKRQRKGKATRDSADEEDDTEQAKRSKKRVSFG